MNFGTFAISVKWSVVRFYGHKFFAVEVGLEIAVFAPGTDLCVGIIGEVDVEPRLSASGTSVVRNLLQELLAPESSQAGKLEVAARQLLILVGFRTTFLDCLLQLKNVE